MPVCGHRPGHFGLASSGLGCHFRLASFGLGVLGPQVCPGSGTMVEVKSFARGRTIDGFREDTAWILLGVLSGWRRLKTVTKLNGLGKASHRIFELFYQIYRAVPYLTQ